MVLHKTNLKHKIITLNKSYKLEDSALFKVNSRKHLAKVLVVDVNVLSDLCTLVEKYNVFPLIGKSGKSREIQNPINPLAKIHSRIASLLCRIEMPNFLHSGKKGYSNVSNAGIHVGKGRELLTVDLVEFYPSTDINMIFNFFHQDLKCSKVVSKILSKLCSYNNRLPTGSQVSMPLAYFANMHMFKEMECLSMKHNTKMSVYVDDITFSSSKIDKIFYHTVRKIAQRHGHNLKHSKTRFYKHDMPKLITGVVVRENELLIRHQHHLEIYQTKELLCVAESSGLEDEANILRSRLIGKLHACGSISPRAKSEAYFYQKKNTQRV